MLATMSSSLIVTESGPEVVDTQEAYAGDGDTLIHVSHSSVNYKDAMALAGKGIARAHPLIPGIDLVGTVTESADARFSPGDGVVLNGDGIGESRHGGFATRARVRPDALVHLPAALTAQRAAAIGTAGFTAMLAVLRLEDAGLTPADGDVLVTGASGGAGSIAIALLAGRGHRVIASTGRGEEHGEYLRSLGAAEVVDLIMAEFDRLGAEAVAADASARRSTSWVTATADPLIEDETSGV